VSELGGPRGLRCCVFGASGGVGAALVEQLAADDAVATVHAGSRRATVDPTTGTGANAARVAAFGFDLQDESTIAASAARIAADGPLDIVIVATGLLHRPPTITPDKTYRAINAPSMAESFAVNAIGPALIAKHLLPLLRKDARSVFAALSARVGSIGDNRLGGWHAYRASKAALNMLVRNFAIEMAVTNRQAVVVALHPGTVDTALSKPFQRGVAADKLFTPTQSAKHLLRVIEGLTPADSGRCIAWDGQRIEP
jgi:NAD(P)-dependent dehydrogenase (short-subunit alcohol dehydrogenase family)